MHPQQVFFTYILSLEKDIKIRYEIYYSASSWQERVYASWHQTENVRKRM